MRLPGRRRDADGSAHAGHPSQVVCPVCGLRNDAMSRFCRNCGLPIGAPRDPVRGTASRRADLPSDHGAGIAAIVGLAAAIVVLVGAGWLILRANSGDGGTGAVPTRTPAATGAVAPTPGLLPTRAPAGSPGVMPTRRPAASEDPSASEPPEATAAPAPSASASAAPLVADTGFTCEAADFDDPTKGTWRISEAMWGARDKWDELTIVLRREEGKGATNVRVEGMSAREAAQVSGLDEATTGRVVLISFDGDVRINSPVVALPTGLRQIRYLNIETTPDGTFVVLGVNRDTCHRMVVPAWKNGRTTAVGDTVKLLLDTRHR